jgi:hypothetical protein
MQTRVERERLLKLDRIEARSLERVENQVPAVRGDRARNRDEAMVAKKMIAEGLLARAYNSRSQPIGVWNVVAFDDVNLGDVGNPRRRQNEGHSVERLEAFVDGNLKDGGRRIEAAA